MVARHVQMRGAHTQRGGFDAVGMGRGGLHGRRFGQAESVAKPGLVRQFARQKRLVRGASHHAGAAKQPGELAGLRGRRLIRSIRLS